MKKYTLIALLFSITLIQAQSFKKEVKNFQNELNKTYKDENKSPLLAKDRKIFKGHPFFKANKKYKVVAQFERTLDALPFAMPTTTDRLPVYKKYGIATFKIDGVTYQLSIFQNQQLMLQEKYKDYLFLPFTDQTNGKETYAGGRFIDMRIPAGDTIIIDFNKAYHPLCAYNPRYSCPIPPAENDLKTSIEAGVMLDPYFKH